MKQKNYKVSVAISALNEEKTIKSIIRDILAQKESGWRLQEVLIYCDGCADDTAKIVRSIGDKRIKIFEAKSKKGKVYRVNQALSAFCGDILLIFDADCKIEGANVITKVLDEFRKGKKVALVGGNTRVFQPKTFFEKVIYCSYIPYYEARKHLKGGHNVFGCTGACFAIRRDFAKKVKIPAHIINEDTYFYFTCLSQGYKFRHAQGAVVRYELAENLKVFIRQIFRTHPEAVLATYKKEFGGLIEEEYKRPKGFYLKSIWNTFQKNPVGTICMIGIKLFTLPFYRLISPKYNLNWYGSDVATGRNIVISSYDDINNPYYAGGGSVAVHEIAKRFAKENKVVIYTGRYPGSKDLEIDRVNYKRIGLGMGGPKFGQLIYHLILPLYVLVSKYDLWIESFTPPFSTSFLQVFTKRPVIGLVHMLSGDDMRRKYKLPFYVIENLGLKTYNKFIVLTDDMKNRISKINRKADIEVIPNGVNIPAAKSSSEGNYVLFLGRIEVNQKGLDLLLKAFKSVSEKSGVKLHIAGSGTKEEEKNLKDLSNKLGFQNSVKFLGRISGKEKDKALKNARLLVVPSRFETFPLSVLEGLSYGKPIVAFDIDGLSWLSEKCVIKVNAFNEKEMADAILNLLRNTRKRKEMGREGRRIVKNYTWDKVYRKYVQFLGQISILNNRRLSI